MLNYWPKMYENELLISILKRYHLMSGNTDNGYSLIDLFDTYYTSIHAQVPTNLNRLCCKIPSEFNINVDELINNHTLFNYYAAFLSEEKKKEMREKMKVDCGNAYKVTKSGEIALNKYLRYCPICVKEQIEQERIFTWNRIHQVSFVCTKHQEMLIDSSYGSVGKDLSYREPNVNVTSLCDKSSIIFLRLLSISRRIEELVIHSSAFTNKQLREVYYIELEKRGLIYQSKNQVYIKELEEQIREYFTNEVLDIVTKGKGTRWVAPMINQYQEDIHPLYHVLMQDFLELDNEKMTTILEKITKKRERLLKKDVKCDNVLLLELYEQIIDTKVKCKNPLAKHYQTEEIKGIEIHYANGLKEFMCTFTCTCGFIYTTSVEDVINSKGEKVSKMKSWGKEYEEGLIKIRHLGIKGIARRTGINVGTIRSQLRNYDKYGSINNAINHTIRTDKQNSDSVVINTKEQENREEKKKSKDKQKEYWEKKDKICYEQIKSILAEEEQSQELPKWITKTSLAKRIGAISQIIYSLDKMPMTKGLIKKSTFSKAEWMRRKIKWAVRKMLEQGEEVKTWRLIQKAQISDENFKKIDKIVKAILEEYTD